MNQSINLITIFETTKSPKGPINTKTRPKYQCILVERTDSLSLMQNRVNICLTEKIFALKDQKCAVKNNVLIHIKPPRYVKNKGFGSLNLKEQKLKS